MNNLKVGDLVGLSKSKSVFEILELPPFDRIVYRADRDHEICIIKQITNESANPIIDTRDREEIDYGYELISRLTPPPIAELKKLKSRVEKQLTNINSLLELLDELQSTQHRIRQHPEFNHPPTIGGLVQNG